jgi:flagellar basal body-associated protein FliL
LPDYILIPILLVILAVGLVALIYWGGFVEERRNSGV